MNISISYNTLHQLFKVNVDSVTLYIFYLTQPRESIQNTIHAPEDYCREKLKWGHSRYQSAKNDLTEYNYIKPIILYDNKNIIRKHYIKILKR